MDDVCVRCETYLVCSTLSIAGATDDDELRTRSERVYICCGLLSAAHLVVVVARNNFVVGHPVSHPKFFLPPRVLLEKAPKNVGIKAPKENSPENLGCTCYLPLPTLGEKSVWPPQSCNCLKTRNKLEWHQKSRRTHFPQQPKGEAEQRTKGVPQVAEVILDIQNITRSHQGFKLPSLGSWKNEPIRNNTTDPVKP